MKGKTISQKKIRMVQLATNPVCSPCRLEAPGRLLNEMEDIEVICVRRLDKKILDYLLSRADMFILQRLPMSKRLCKLLDALTQAGVVIVFEIDDDLFHLEKNSRFEKITTADLPKRIKQTILRCHAVQCSTQPLAEVIAQFHDEVVVLENQLESIPQFIHKPIDGRPLRVGYAAGEDHGLDWQFIKDSYNKVLRECEQHGFEIETWIIGDQSIYDSVLSTHKKYLPFLDHRKYRDALGCFDISLMPLADNQFNRCKSDIKFLESAACSCAVIASEVVYGNSIVDGETGLLFKNSLEFESRLKRLTKNPHEISQIARRAHQYVGERRILSQHIYKWQQTYLDWLVRKDQLWGNSSARLRPTLVT